MVEVDQMDEENESPAYRLGKKIQKKYGKAFDIIVVGGFAKDSALLRIRKK